MTLKTYAPRYITSIVLWILVFSPGIHLIPLARYGIRVEQVAILLFVVIVLPIMMFYRYEKQIPKHFLLLLAPFFALLVSVTSSDLYAAIGPYTGIMRFTGFGVIGYLLTREENFYNLLSTIQKACFFILLLALLQQGKVKLLIDIIHYLYPSISYSFLFGIPTVTFANGEPLARFLVLGFVAVFFIQKKVEYKLLLVPIYLYYFYISEAFGVLFGVMYFILLLPFHKNRTFIFWFSLLSAIASVYFIVSFFEQLIIRDDIFSANLLTRLTETWFVPVLSWSSSSFSVFFGDGLHMPYGDGGFTAPLAQIGIVGIVFLYMPLFYFMLHTKNNSCSYIKYFWFVILILAVSNVSYQAFSVSRQADIFWFVFGAIFKMLDVSRRYNTRVFR
jgi:hypothetical protein